MSANSKTGDAGRNPRIPTATHWGHFLVEVEGDEISSVHNYSDDPDPSPIGQSLRDSRDANCRIDQPMVRQSYRERPMGADGALRGREPFVAIGWDEALDLAADALEQTRNTCGNAAIYGGSYGWASAGRFHHAQSQIHRFLEKFGGYTASENSYSGAAAEVLVPHIFGHDFFTHFLNTPPWSDVRDEGELIVCFGGVSPTNVQVIMGGAGAHHAARSLREVAQAGVTFVNISPLRVDLPEDMAAEWIPIRPGTDTALLLALCHTLVRQGLHDREFLERYTVGFERFAEYLMGRDDGVVKDAAWAETICSIPASTIVGLAERMAHARTFIPMALALQRAEHGEQPYWAGAALVALLGQYGLPGAGIGYTVGSLATTSVHGRRVFPFSWGSFPLEGNPIDSAIPVARISDMLENPGAGFHFNGRSQCYPDIRLIYWAGGNPFHHHQDLNRLRRAWAKPACVIVNEQVWTATARHADIVFPITTSLERNDVSFNTFDMYVTPMPQAVPAFAQSRNDYDVFSALARRLGIEEAFTEGRSEMEWVRHIYDVSTASAAAHGIELPEFDAFWAGGHFSLADQVEEVPLIGEAFRADPQANPLGTPSGKIEIYSETIAAFEYDDCPGHPVWLEKEESLGSPRAQDFPLHLISNQPATRLHSQLDFGALSRENKVADREPLTMHPADAAARGIHAGNVVRVFNDRGACLAGVRLSDGIRAGVVQISTGAWYDPIDTADGMALDVHGNPNVLTRDVGTSKLAQGTTAHSCLVDVERFEGTPPKVQAFTPPEILRDR